jgi:hypothetical protein
MILYISGPGGRIYHIVLERGRAYTRAYTLCGLKVQSLKVSAEEPKNGVLCKHCERLREREPSDRSATH